MKKLIALDPGHGLNTIGKRTPYFSNNTYMKEREFNKAVAENLQLLLEKAGFDVLNVAFSDIDVPLGSRTALANNTIPNSFNRPVDFYLSIHANAYGDGITFNTANGIESYVYTNVSETSDTYKYALAIQNALVNATNLRNRGVKRGNFQVLRETSMPAVLVECGFMTNEMEALLLLNDAYRNTCARALAESIISIFPGEVAADPVAHGEADGENQAQEEITQWQLDAFNSAVAAGVFASPEYWQAGLANYATIAEVIAVAEVYKKNIRKELLAEILEQINQAIEESSGEESKS